MSAIAAPNPANEMYFTSGVLPQLGIDSPDKSAIAQAEGSPLDLTLVTTRQQFDALEAEWNALFQAVGKPGNPFQSFNWCWHWANNFLEPDMHASFMIVTGRRNGRLMMIWPLVCHKSAGLTHLTWIGRPVTQYGDVLLDSPEPLEDLRAGWKFLKENAKADTVELFKVRADAAVAPLLSEIGAIATHRDAAPYADMSQHATFQDYAQQKYSKKRRSVLRRYHRRFEEMGQVETKVLHEGAEAAAATEKILAMKMKWLEAKSLVSKGLQDPRSHKFFVDAAGDSKRPTGCRLTLLTCDDNLIAADINFAVKNQSAAHIITYDLDYDKLRPGHLMTFSNLEECKKDGIEVFDFMGPDAQFKRDWSDKAIEVNDWAVPLSWKGKLWCKVYLGFARDQLKQGFQRLPTAVKKAIAGTFTTLLIIADKI